MWRRNAAPANRADGSCRPALIAPCGVSMTKARYWAARSLITAAHGPHVPGWAARSASRVAGMCSSTIPPRTGARRGLTEEAAKTAVDQACRRLRLPTMRAVLDEALKVAEREQLSYQGFLAELLLAECDDRDRRSSIRRVKAAGFPREKWLGDFDFEANPNINPATIHTLATGDWIRRGNPLCLTSATPAPARATC